VNCNYCEVPVSESSSIPEWALQALKPIKPKSRRKAIEEEVKDSVLDERSSSVKEITL
jgi:hypothetical protein